MKKYKLIMASIVFLLIICSIFILISKNNKTDYPKGGRDTVCTFGNRRIVILSSYNYENNKKIWILYDRENGTIDNEIYSYKEKIPYVYTIGKEGYIRLNYNSGEYKQYNKLKEIDDKEDKIIFENLQNRKDGSFS